MRSSSLSSISVIILLTGSTAGGYFYNFCVDKKVIDKKTNKCQMVIGLFDYHDKAHPVNKDQRDYLNVLLKKCVAMKAKLIVEDLSSVNNEGRMIYAHCSANSSQGILGQLASKARALGVMVDNVEYRYCRVAGIGPLLNNLTLNPHSVKSAGVIAAGSLYDEVINEIEKIKKYDDGKVLNNIYKRTLADVLRDLSHCAFDAHKKRTIACYCSNLGRTQYRQELERLCIFDSALIDMNIMHSIVSAPDAPIIFVVAGGSHIEHVSSILKRIGYKTVFASSQSPYNIPLPIDVSILDKFIP